MNSKIVNVLEISARADRSGGPKHLLDLIQSIKTAKIQIHGAFPHNQDLSRQLQSNCFKSIHLPSRFFSLNKFIDLFNYCKNNNIDLIHSHGRGAGIYSRLLSITRIPVVHTFHGVHNEQTLIGQLKVFADRFLKVFTQKFIFVSNDEMSQGLSLKLAYPRKSRVIFNGVDEEGIKDSSQEELNIRKKLNISTNITIVGSIGRLTYQKGFDLLLKLIASNKPLFKQYHFVIGGTGNDEKKLNQLKNKYKIDNLTFVGELKKPYPFLAQIDYYLSSSRWEGLPLTVLEAFALHKPCILTDVTGHKDFKKLANFYGIKDPNSLLKALSKAAPLSNFPKEFALDNMTYEVERTYINPFY